MMIESLLFKWPFHMIILHISLILIDAPKHKFLNKLILLNDAWHINCD